jgi:hypothetical protein
MRPVIAVATLASLLAVASPACKRKAPPEILTATVEAGADGLPADFPTTIPAYPGWKDLVATKDMSPQGKPTWSLAFSTSDDPNAVSGYYFGKLRGFKGSGENRPGGERASDWESQQYSVGLRCIPAGPPDAQPAGSTVRLIVSRK